MSEYDFLEVIICILIGVLLAYTVFDSLIRAGIL